MKTRSSKLRVGDWVEVRSREEILRTLDPNAQLDGMPFMPEMFAFCGRKFQVYKRAHKTCDTVFPVRGRRVHEAIHLNTRCDGQAHGGCQASCLLFWKEAWLKPVVTDASTRGPGHPETGNVVAPAGCTESDVSTGTRVVEPDGSITYICQATRLPYATQPLEWWDIRQYIEDYTSGNVGLWRIIRGGIYSFYFHLSNAGIGLGPAMRWLYDKCQVLWGGPQWPRKTGPIADGQETPTASQNLQPGELVRIKPYHEILETLNQKNKNRGLYFDAEEVPYCGETHRVLKRVTKIIDERTGKMRDMKTPSLILDSVICESRYSECRLFCPRSIYSYWREIWLERVGPETPSAAVDHQPELVTATGDDRGNLKTPVNV